MQEPDPLTALAARIDELELVFSAERKALWRALDSIAEDPHKELIREVPRVAPARVDVMAPHLLGLSALEPGAIMVTDRRAHFRALRKKWRYVRVLSESSRISTDTVPNQVAAHFLRRLLRETRHLTRTLDALPDAPSEHREWLRRFRGRLTGLLQQSPALRDASTPGNLSFANQALTQEPRYARILEAYLTLL